MSIITHIAFGGKDHTPTQEELDEVLKDFQEKNINGFDAKHITINDIDLCGFIEPCRLVVYAGDKQWSPTKEELNHLIDQFAKAVDAVRKGAAQIVVTRHSVRVALMENYRPVVQKPEGDTNG